MSVEDAASMSKVLINPSLLPFPGWQTRLFSWHFQQQDSHHLAEKMSFPKTPEIEKDPSLGENIEHAQDPEKHVARDEDDGEVFKKNVDGVDYRTNGWWVTCMSLNILTLTMMAQDQDFFPYVQSSILFGYLVYSVCLWTGRCATWLPSRHWMGFFQCL